MKRIFAAIQLSDKARRKIGDYINRLRRGHRNLRVGWEKREKLHLTMKFLGDLDEERLEDLHGAVKKTATQIAPFVVDISGTGVFPNPKNPRILWLGIRNPERNLAGLNRVLETECARAGFAREKRAFKPHLTIGRLRQPYHSTDLVAEHLASNIEPVSFAAGTIAVVESKLQPTGSVYSVLAEHKFTAG